MYSLYRVSQNPAKNLCGLQWTKNLGISYSGTSNLFGVEIRQQGVLMSIPCSQISTPYRLVVSENEVAKVFVRCKPHKFFWDTLYMSGTFDVVPKEEVRIEPRTGVGTEALQDDGRDGDDVDTS